MINEAFFYSSRGGHQVRCLLCPHECLLKDGQTGVCRVRRNDGGRLVTDVFGRLSAISIDPVEKKPLYHFYPGRPILSVGSVGCNMRCVFCQNYTISQCYPDEFSRFRDFSPGALTQLAQQTPDNIGLAYTYNEPFTFYEFMLETAMEIRRAGMKNVVVSNGYINPEPLDRILPLIDAFNIDLKAFNETFYRKQTRSKLAPVLKTLQKIACSDAHLEITNLVVPGLNDRPDEFSEMVDWIASELGKHVPLHLSRYFPQYQLTLPPTSGQKLEELYLIARQKLDFVYIGNMGTEDRANTHCPHCGKTLIRRDRYDVELSGISASGHCSQCNQLVIPNMGT